MPQHQPERSSALPLTSPFRILLVGLVALSVVLPLGARPVVAAEGDITFVAQADSYVDASKPTRNFGTRNELRADGSPVLTGYLRFTVSGVAEFPGARLRLFMRSGASQGIEVRGVSDTTWDEQAITADNAPAFGPVVTTSAPAPAGAWLEVDVSSLVTQNGPVSFAITTTHSTAVAIRSRESSEQPQLIVGGSPGPGNQDPVAAFTHACTNLACSFDAATSFDPDGSITNYAWNFGGGATASGVTAQHTFPSAGSHDVTLTVTDNGGATGQVTQSVSVSGPPPPTGTAFTVTRNGSTYQASSSSHTFTGSLKTVVESAVSVLGSGGGTISFTAGDFDLGTDHFELYDVANLTFQGAGMGATTIRNFTNAASDTEVFDVVGALNLTVRDLTVSAGGALRSTSDALDFDQTNSSTVLRVEVINSRARGIIFDGKGSGWTADNNVVRDCVISGLPGKGIELLASRNNLIEGCTITNVAGHGIQVNKSSTSAAQPNKKSNDNIIRDNVITGSGENGIYVNSSDRTTITGNTILNSSRLVSSRDGIRIASSDGITCDDNVVDGNTATDNQTPKTQTWGLNIASSLCNRTVVGAANNFAGNRVGSINDQGTGTIYPPSSGDTEPPSVPNGLQATAVSGCRVELSWEASTDNVGVAGYGVYRGTTLIASLNGATLTYADTGVSPGTTYSYAVDAVDAAGNRSDPSGAVNATTPATSCSITQTASADSYVEAASPTTNNGTKTQVRVDNTPVVTSYLKFSGVGGTVTSAILRIWVNSNHATGFDVRVSGDTSWSETAITYANAPAYGGVIGSSGSFTGGSWVSIDVTSAVSGGPVTFVLTTTSSTAMSLASRETGAQAPQLVIQAS